MKKEKKAVMAVALLACTAMFAVAQTTVTSANIVGYNKVSGNAGLQIVGVIFENETAETVQSFYGDTLPTGSQVFQFVPPAGPYASVSYDEGFFGQPDSWSGDLTLTPGQAYWIRLPAGSSSVTNIAAGEVNIEGTVDVDVVAGLQLINNPYPTELTISTAGLDPNPGDAIFVFVPPAGPYASVSYDEGFFGQPDSWSGDITIGVGEGFWYRSVSNYTWTITRPF